MFRLRSAVLATAFAATVAAGLTGATLTGETRETSLDQTCAHQTWPAIPAYCLTGEVKQAVRVIPPDGVSAPEMRARFAIAFQ